MNRITLFFFVAVFAASVLAGGIAPKGWYQPEGGFTTLRSDALYTVGKGELSESYGCTAVADKDGNITYEWQTKTGVDLLDFTIERAAGATLLAKRNTERVETLANTVYNNIVTGIGVDPQTKKFGYFTVDENGNQKFKGEIADLGYRFDAVEYDGANGYTGLTYNGQPVGPSAVPFCSQLNHSECIEQLYNEDANGWYTQLTGFNTGAAVLKDLAYYLNNDQSTRSKYKVVIRIKQGEQKPSIGYLDIGELAGSRGDNKTIRVQDVADEGESGETHKEISLYSAPSNRIVVSGKDIYGAYMDDAGHLAWSVIVGASVAPTLGDFVTLSNSVVPIVSGTTTNREERLHIRGFYDAEDGSFLTRKSAGEVEWKKLAINGKNGIKVGDSNSVVEIENFTAAAAKNLSELAGSSDWNLLARQFDSTGGTNAYSVQMVSVDSFVSGDGASIIVNTNKQVAVNGYVSAANNAIPYKHSNASSNNIAWTSAPVGRGSVLRYNGDSGVIDWTHPGPNYSMYYGTGKGDTEVGWHPLSDFVSIGGVGSIKVKDGAVSNNLYNVQLTQCGEYGMFCSGVDGDGFLKFDTIDDPVSNAVMNLVTRQYITNEVNDLYVLCAGDNMTGDLWVKATVSANQLETDGLLIANNAEVSNAVRTASIMCSGTISGNSGSFANVSISAASFGSMSAETASASTLSVTTLTVTATANLPTNGVKIGDAELSIYVDEAAKAQAEEVVKNATNAMASTFKTFSLTVDGDATLPDNTTINGVNPVTELENYTNASARVFTTETLTATMEVTLPSNTKIDNTYPVLGPVGEDKMTLSFSGTNLIIKIINNGTETSYWVPMIMGAPL